jgi:hypothetical protein
MSAAERTQRQPQLISPAFSLANSTRRERRTHSQSAGFCGGFGFVQYEQGSYGGSFAPNLTGRISTFWPVPRQYLHFG